MSETSAGAGARKRRRMNALGTLLAVGGFAVAATLFADEDVGAIGRLLATAGAGLLVAAAVHVAPMIVNAAAWRLLFVPGTRPRLPAVVKATWIRESVNGLLPVGRIGGEIVAWRTLRRAGAAGIETGAALVADMVLAVFSLAVFALAGVAALSRLRGGAVDVGGIALGIGALAVAAALLVWAQHAGALAAIGARLARTFAGRFDEVQRGGLRIDDALRGVYARRADVAACFALQVVGWSLGAAEIAVALHFLGYRQGPLDALVLEALVQAASSAAFAVPAALGVQEGAFLVVGTALGLDGATALSLAAARRLRDVVVFFPGLAAWILAEARARDADVPV